MSPAEAEITVSSRLEADPTAVWDRVITPAGINDEMRPIMRMTTPPGVERLDPDTIELGKRIGRSWVLLFGLIPFDYDDLTLVRLDPGRGFLERSSMLSQRVWEHERTLEPAGGECLITDRVRWEPRLGLPGRPLRPLIGFFFRHRHSRLRRRFGALRREARALLTERVESWRREGSTEDVFGRRLFVHRREGSETPLLLYLHGFPSSSYDWRPLLEARRGGAEASIAFDFLGFGLSEKPADHVYTLAWQADAAEELVRRAGSPPVFIVGHDMGTSVATELMARDISGGLDMNLAGAMLFNGSMLLHLARPTVGQKLLRSRLGPLFARLTSERTFRAQFSRIFSPQHPLSEEEAADQWSLLTHDGGARIAHLTINYMAERERFTDRWHGAIRDWPGTLTLAWGMLDPVARTEVLRGLQELRPGVKTIELPDLGHYPQIEDPAAIGAALDAALRHAATGGDVENPG